jgi:hypothetical protein
MLIKGMEQKYMDLRRSKLRILCQIQNAADTNPAADTVSTIINPLHSLFSNIELILGNRTISDANGFYAHRAYMETILFGDTHADASEMEKVCWNKDTPGQI